MERARPAPADAAAHEAAMIRSPAAHLRLSIRAPIVRQFRNSPPVLSAGKRLNAQKYHIVLVEL
jgi:hypothetical protein